MLSQESKVHRSNRRIVAIGGGKRTVESEEEEADEADGSPSGRSYEDPRDCPSAEQEQAGSCTTDSADAECWRMNSMMVHYAWCEHLTPGATNQNGGEPCGCAETCRRRLWRSARP